MYLFVVHPETNAFWDMPFGASPAGIHLAAGPDRMHLLYEGLGQSLITWISAILVATGSVHCTTLMVHWQLTMVHCTRRLHVPGMMKTVNDYVLGLNTRTNDPNITLYPVSKGIETMSIISAMHVPSVLIQVDNVPLQWCVINALCLRQLSLAIGDRTVDGSGLTLAVTKRIQLCIHLFLQLSRCMSAFKHTTKQITV